MKELFRYVVSRTLLTLLLIFIVFTLLFLIFPEEAVGAHRLEQYRCRVAMKGYHIFARTRARSESHAAYRIQQRYPKGRVQWCKAKN